MYIRFIAILLQSPPQTYTLLPMFRSTRRPAHGTPCATDPELWFGYPDDDGSDGAAKARAYERSATQARINACAGARSYSSAGVLNTRSSIGWSTAYGPASSFPAASTESANSSRQPTTCCVGLPAARSIPGSSRTMRLCWPATEGLEVTPVPGVVVHLPIAQVGPQPAA